MLDRYDNVRVIHKCPPRRVRTYVHAFFSQIYNQQQAIIDTTCKKTWPVHLDLMTNNHLQRNKKKNRVSMTRRRRRNKICVISLKINQYWHKCSRYLLIHLIPKHQLQEKINKTETSIKTCSFDFSSNKWLKINNPLTYWELFISL